MFDFLSIIFPISCFGCGKPETYLCSNCLQTKIDFNPAQKCAICNRPAPNGQTHSRCFTPHSIDGVFSITHKNLLITKLIKQLKYRHSHHIITSFKPIISQTPNLFTNFDFIIPIPLHPKRLRERGFNQAELLANLFDQQLKLPIYNQLLIRSQYTQPQADLQTRDSRIKNLNHVFAVSQPEDKKLIFNKRILLIDDVSTTGATLYQACLPLKQAGASQIWGLVIAR